MNIEQVQLPLQQIRDYLATQPVVKAWLFGSYSRGEQTPQSDVDLLVRYDKAARVSLFTIGRMLYQMEDLLGKPVDIVGEEGLMPFARPSVDRDKILIYER